MYYIYHIPEVKIGCSTQPNKRVKSQGYDDFEILEEYIDIDIASDREQELQKQYGYRVDECRYSITYDKNFKRREKLTKEERTLAGKIAGSKNVESGWIYEFQKRSVLARTGSKHSVKTKQKMSKSAILRGNNKPTIPVIVYDLQNNIVGEYSSLINAVKAHNLRQGNASMVLNGKLKTTGGFIIKYK